MKRKGRYIIVVILIAVFVPAVLFVGTCIFRQYQIENLKEQQNYMASRLLEMGEYEQGRTLAVQNNQMRENSVSKELIVLAAGFQADYESGIQYADAFLQSDTDTIIQNAKDIYQYLLEESVYISDVDETVYQEEDKKPDQALFEQLMELLFKTEEQIHAKIENETLQAMLDVMSMGTASTSESIAILEKDNSILSKKVQASYSLQTGNYEKAFADAESLLKKTGIFEYRALLANIVALKGTGLNQAEAGNEVSNSKIQAKKAINYIETTTPIIYKNSAAYDMERAFLYFYADKKEKAKELLMEVLVDVEDGSDTVAMLVSEITQTYRQSNSWNKDQYMQVCWARIEQLLYFIEDSNYGNMEEHVFYAFLLETMNSLYNTLIIREIDSTDFPIVHVTVNAAFESDKLQKDDFHLADMGIMMKDFSVEHAEKTDSTETVSVALVVDHSGSMDGQPLEDTKNAVSSFVREINTDTRVSLIAFDDAAQVVVPMTDYKNAILQGIRTIYSGGGTSIWSGLQAAGDELLSETGKKIIILLSDGEDGDTAKIDEVLDLLNQRNIYVYTIGFGGADTNYLSYIANKCNGKFLQAQSSEMLGEIYAQIGSYMVNEYVITFTAVTEPENFTRICNLSLNENVAFAQKEYHVGVPYEKILEEQDRKPMADYFKEIGGSRME